MNGLVCCAEILGVLLFIPWSAGQTVQTLNDSETSTPWSEDSPNDNSSDQEASTVPAVSVRTDESTSSPLQLHQTTPTITTRTTTSPLTAVINLMKNYPYVLITCVALIIVCTILLISTLALACKVCQLRRDLRAESSNGNLVGNSEYWIGMNSRNKEEAKENSCLLRESSKTNQQIDGNATKEDGGTVGEEGQDGEKKVGDAQEDEEAATPAAPEERSPPSKEEEATNSETFPPPPPASSEDPENPNKEP